MITALEIIFPNLSPTDVLMMTDQNQKSKKFKNAASNLAIDPESEDGTPPSYKPDTSNWDPDDFYGMTEEEAMESNLMEVLMNQE